MSRVVIAIRPKKPALDPLATQVKNELIEAGQKPTEARVSTERLFQLDGNFPDGLAERIAETLLVDPVVETYTIEREDANKKTKVASHGDVVVDVWPRPGVTDPVAQTVEKGLRDMALPQHITAATAVRYIFLKTKETRLIETVAKRTLANELIHDIRIREI